MVYYKKVSGYMALTAMITLILGTLVFKHCHFKNFFCDVRCTDELIDL